MAVQGVNNAYYNSSASANQKRQVGDDLGKDAFLQILVAQMANQDPLSPTSDTEFIAQMAQFSSLEQMQNLNETMTTQAAYSYMSKDVTAETAVTSDGVSYPKSVYGTVIGVSHVNGGNYLQVKNYDTGEILLVAPDQVRQTIDTGSQQKEMMAMISQILANTQRSADAAEAAAVAAMMGVSGETEETEEVEGAGEVGDAGSNAADVETPETPETPESPEASVVPEAPEAPEAESGGEAVPEDSAAL